MSSNRLWTWQRATALVPLALLSGAWTASLATSATATAADEGGKPLPDGTMVPAEAIEAPASVSVPGEIAPGVPAGAADNVIADASTNGIPGAALAAYQRAAQVLDSADPSCNISWPLIAAIGRVESNHGRYGGNTLTDSGLSQPGIYGIPLDGSNGTARIDDTDAGELDDDPIFDRAVGPMQFIPSTWAVVGVDGDGDGIRNPQDIDDAALATAVYLCSGDENLSTTKGLRSAVYRYNHSEEYVDLVLSIMAAYAQGDFSAIPNGSFAPTTFAPSFGGGFSGGTDSTDGRKNGGKADGGKPSGDKASGGGATNGGGSDNGSPAGGDSGDDLVEGDTGGIPSLPGTGGGGSDGGGGGDADGDSSGPVDDATDPLPDEVESPVDEVLSPLEKATNYCQDNSGPLGMQQCINAYLDGGAGAVQSLIDSLTDPVGGLTGGGGNGDGDGDGGGGLLGGDGLL